MTMMGLVSNFFVHCVDDVPGDDASIRVWFTDLDQQKTETTQFSWLSTSEKVRAARLKSPLARQRYVTSRVFTRRLLSDLTGILPENLEILADKCGKPYLNLPVAAHHLSSESLLRFNISHSENAFCIATALGSRVGVDIEVVNPNLDVLAISDASLQPEDIDRVQRSSLDERSLVFYRIWTRREAFAKMLGHGVSSDHVHAAPAPSWSLRSLEFTLSEKQIEGSLAIAVPNNQFDDPFSRLP